MEGCVPIVEVTEDNFHKMLPTIQRAIQEASFISIDCELTGLGERGKMNYPEIDIRYRYTAENARNYAIISLGISCFTCKSVSTLKLQGCEDDQTVHSHDYLVQTFNLLTLCSETFTVECQAQKFLLKHGFDFNKLYSKGLQYYKGCDRKTHEAPSVRSLFCMLVEHQKPIVIHNGLLDLLFLYQSFYADLPKNMDTFAADLSDMFPRGIYDTKYVAEYHQSLPASYLEYLFKKFQLRNKKRGSTGDWHVRVRFPPYPASLPSVDWQPYLQVFDYHQPTDDDDKQLCLAFAYHGWCAKSSTCVLSHDINKIAKTLQLKGAKKRKKSRCSATNGSLVQIIQSVTRREENLKQAANPISETPAKKVKLNASVKSGSNGVNESVVNGSLNGSHVKPASGGGGHRAGFDAFMTGFIFACHVSENSKLSAHVDQFTPEVIGLSEQVNRVYLMGKNVPFLIRTGTYASFSANHTAKIAKVRKGDIG